MGAFLFTLTLLTYWGVIGFATTSIFPPRLRLIQGVLISPVIGIAVTILPVFFINRAGIPVKEFGAALTSGLFLLAVLVILLKRPIFPLARILPYLGLMLAGLVLAARPMFSYGFDWISFANDDMANYSLGAQRFYENGFFAPPDIKSFFQGKDYSQAFWFMHVLNNTRSGSELLLANIWATTGVNPHRAFMPIIFALHGSLILATAAMLVGRGMPKYAGMIGAALVAISPMTTLGALYQLIAQVGGLALLCTAIVLVYRPLPNMGFMKQIQTSITAVLILGCLFVYYPEVLPFLGAGWVVFLGWAFLRGNRIQLKRIVYFGLLIGVCLSLVLNTYIFGALQFLLRQAKGGSLSANAAEILFPYFLVPNGIPVAWGIMPIARDLGEPFNSGAIFVGLLLLVTFFRILYLQFKKSATGVTSVAVVIFVGGSVLFIRNNDFGLFKLVMFSQPFILGVMAIGVASIAWRKAPRWHIAAMTAILVAAILVQNIYVEKSKGESLGSLAEIPYASRDGIIRQFAERQESFKNINSPAILTTSHIVLAKLQALYTRGTPVLFPARQFLVGLIENENGKALARYTVKPEVEQYIREKNENLTSESVITTEGTNNFLQLSNKTVAREHFDLKPGQIDIFNRYGNTGRQTNYFSSQKNSGVLDFIHSDLGQHYYLGRAGHISYYALENDPMFANREFAALGRHILFSVNSAEVNPRLVMELTSTLAKHFQSELPNSRVQGSPIGFVGRGSGRVFSQPLTLSVINDSRYLAVDMARASRPMRENKRGLMLAYGRDIPLDRRLITTFGRDISLVPESLYRALIPPSSVSLFPMDLANPSLEYSGIYEDGWISEQSFFSLLAQPASRFLVVKGSVPQIKDQNFSSTLKLSINTREVAQQKIGLGNFEVKIPVSALLGRQRIDLTFTNNQQLPGEDGRITGGKIDFIGFTEK